MTDPPGFSPPQDINATACVFDLIERTTPALIVSKEPCVNLIASKHLKAIRQVARIEVLFVVAGIDLVVIVLSTSP